jgi:hypothetical protein
VLLHRAPWYELICSAPFDKRPKFLNNELCAGRSSDCAQPWCELHEQENGITQKRIPLRRTTRREQRVGGCVQAQPPSARQALTVCEREEIDVLQGGNVVGLNNVEQERSTDYPYRNVAFRERRVAVGMIAFQ